MTRVLVVDDERSLRITLRELLSDAGYEVDVAENADDAMGLLSEGRFDVVITDIIMPRRGGIELLRDIQTASPEAQVILMTGEPTVETASDAVRDGAFDYLAKPVPPSRLLTAVANATRLSELNAERQQLAAENLRYQEDLEQLVSERTIALQQSEAQYRLLADNATDIIWTTDEDLNYTYISPAVEKLRGLTAKEAMAIPFSDSMTEESYERARALWLATEDREVERHDDSSLSGSPRMTVEVELIHKDGSTFWAEMSMSPLLDDNGRSIGVLGVTRDISDRRHAEQILQHSQRMEAMGRLTSGIAHDFNNILGIILGNLDLLRMHTRHDPDTANRVDVITTAARRAVTVTNQLLGFSRRQTTEAVVTDLSIAIERLSAMVAHAVAPETTVDYQLADHLWDTEIDVGDFEAALLNLAINARDAMEPDGRISLQTTNCTVDPGRTHAHGVAPGEYVRLSVQDNGRGMSPEVQDQVFEPFFTTKPTGDGTGLGLSLVFGFVQRSNGHIHVTSQADMGTIFDVYLPRYQPQSGATGEGARG